MRTEPYTLYSDLDVPPPWLRVKPRTFFALSADPPPPRCRPVCEVLAVSPADAWRELQEEGPSLQWRDSDAVPDAERRRGRCG